MRHELTFAHIADSKWLHPGSAAYRRTFAVPLTVIANMLLVATVDLDLIRTYKLFTSVNKTQCIKAFEW